MLAKVCLGAWDHGVIATQQRIGSRFKGPFGRVVGRIVTVWPKEVVAVFERLHVAGGGQVANIGALVVLVKGIGCRVTGIAVVTVAVAIHEPGPAWVGHVLRSIGDVVDEGRRAHVLIAYHCVVGK